jgi:hypothetical protein
MNDLTGVRLLPPQRQVLNCQHITKAHISVFLTLQAKKPYAPPACAEGGFFEAIKPQKGF